MFYELPNELQAKVYGYDTTYRIFENENFKKEIACGYFSLRSVRAKAILMVDEYFSDLQNKHITWSGVESYMQEGMWMYDEEYHHEWQELSDNYDIDLCPKANFMAFRLLRKWRSCPAVNEYDGFVRRDGRVGLFEDVIYN
jgi:hypothetical protein